VCWGLPSKDSSRYATDIIIEVFYMIDMVLSFFLVYYDEESASEIKDFTKTTIHYIRTDFFIDALTLIPWVYFLDRSKEST